MKSIEAIWLSGRTKKQNQQIVAACTHELVFPTRTDRGTQDTLRRADL